MLVGVQLSVVGLYLPPVLVVSPAPDDHFTVGPDCRMKPSTIRCLGGTSGSPTVGARIVSPAGVKPRKSSPNDHFIAGPHGGVIASGVGRVYLLVAVQLSVPGLYLPPLFNIVVMIPPQTIISVPVQTARVTGSGGGALSWCWWLSSCR